MAKDKLIIFDTTMRDGEQSPGASMTKEEKIRIARQLERMRVDVIEAGFPASSDGDFDAVRTVASLIKDSTVCGLARANENDIRRCGEAIKPAGSGRVHTFIASSPSHMQMKLRMTPEQVVRMLNNYLGTMAEVITAHNGAIDEFIIHVIPTFIGEGIPLIAPRHRTVPLKLLSTKKFSDGVVRLHYQVGRQEAKKRTGKK